jgi:hypothetical protein
MVTRSTECRPSLRRRIPRYREPAQLPRVRGQRFRRRWRERAGARPTSVIYCQARRTGRWSRGASCDARAFSVSSENSEKYGPSARETELCIESSISIPRGSEPPSVSLTRTGEIQRLDTSCTQRSTRPMRSSARCEDIGPLVRWRDLPKKVAVVSALAGQTAEPRLTRLEIPRALGKVAPKAPPARDAARDHQLHGLAGRVSV